VGKGAFAPCPPSGSERKEKWWARFRFAHPTILVHSPRHCEERSDEAIQSPCAALDCFAFARNDGGGGFAALNPPLQHRANCESVQETEKLYKSLSENGKITMELGETFWALRYAMFKDKFGIHWMLNLEKPQQ